MIFKSMLTDMLKLSIVFLHFSKYIYFISSLYLIHNTDF